MRNDKMRKTRNIKLQIDKAFKEYESGTSKE